MILDSKIPSTRSWSPQGSSPLLGASTSIPSSHSSPIGDLHHSEPSETPFPQATGDLSAPTPHSLDRQFPALDENHSNDEPPPAYEAVPVSSVPHHPTRRVLKRPLPSVGSHQSINSQIRVDLLEPAHTSPLNSPESLSPCFQRPVPDTSSSTTYERLPQPFVIQAKMSKHQLPDLFDTVGVPALHKHDVREEDWEYLLQEMASCTRYSSGQRVIAGALPITRRLGPPGTLASLAVEQSMRKQKISRILELLDLWNDNFFGPRKLEAILCKGDKCKSGRRVGFLAPDRMDTPPITPPKTERGSRCCNHSRARSGGDPDKPYRLVVVSILH